MMNGKKNQKTQEMGKLQKGLLQESEEMYARCESNINHAMAALFQAQQNAVIARKLLSMVFDS